MLESCIYGVFYRLLPLKCASILNDLRFKKFGVVSNSGKITKSIPSINCLTIVTAKNVLNTL